jgi:peptidoglycan/LPS O-acetylase OafA/YrhL
VAGLPTGSTGTNKLFIILGILSAASLMGFALLYQKQQPTAYFLMPFRFWELGAGSLLLLWSRTKAQGLPPTRPRPSLPIAVALILSLFIPLEQGRIATIGVVALTCALIYCLHPATRPIAC